MQLGSVFIQFVVICIFFILIITKNCAFNVFIDVFIQFYHNQNKFLISEHYVLTGRNNFCDIVSPSISFIHINSLNGNRARWIMRNKMKCKMNAIKWAHFRSGKWKTPYFRCTLCLSELPSLEWDSKELTSFVNFNCSQLLRIKHFK